MRSFLITSPAFSGSVEIVFNSDGTLIKIDAMQAAMPKAIIRVFKEKCPAHIDELEQAFKSTNATVVEADFEVTFDMFWKAYDKKINKKRAEPLWNKLGKTKQVKAWSGIKAYNKFLSKVSWRPKADPENYLRNEMWENEWS